jgi:lysozyme
VPDADRIVERIQREESNVRAFLATIRACEGTRGPNGYRALFGFRESTQGPCFQSFADHPRVYHEFTQTDGTRNRTSAAGAYQIIVPTYERMKRQLGVTDFTPESQDRMAIGLIENAAALRLVREGRFREAADACAHVWASLPSSMARQPKRTWPFALAAYMAAGGDFA